MATTATMPTTRRQRPPTLPRWDLPKGVNPARGAEYAHALWCAAANYRDGLALHRDAARTRAAARLPGALYEQALEAAKATEARWIEAYRAGNAGDLREAALAHHAAMLEAAAMKWRPAGVGLTSPRLDDLHAAVAESADVVGYWARVVLELNLGTEEQIAAGLGTAAAMVAPLWLRAEQAARALQAGDIDRHREKHARATVDAHLDLIAQVQAACEGLDGYEWEV